MEFEINREYVGRIVGSGGAAANKLRETLGVSLDFSDDTDEKEADGKTKKKKTVSKCHVKVRFAVTSLHYGTYRVRRLLEGKRMWRRQKSVSLPRWTNWSAFRLSS